MGAEVDNRFGDSEFISEIQKSHDFTDSAAIFAKSTAKLARMHQMVLVHKDRLPIKKTAQRLKMEYPIFQKICIENDIQLATAMLIASFLDFEGSLDKLLNLIQSLPNQYRLVFSLYELDQYSHKEISEMLQISEGTSKSNLYKAKRILKNQIVEFKSKIVQNGY